MDEAKQKQVIVYMDALDAYREMLSELNQQQFDKILEAFKLHFNVPLKVSEIRVFLIKVGEAYCEKKVKRLLDATEDGKLIEGHAQTPRWPSPHQPCILSCTGLLQNQSLRIGTLILLLR